MSSFTTFSGPLDIRYDPVASKILDADHWRVLREFRYYIGKEGSDQWVTVPAGYLTDGASVPRALWSLIPPWGAYGQAAVVHDLLCEYLSIVDDGRPHIITRERCDQILDEAMMVLGVDKQIRETISNGVNIYRVVNGITMPTNTALKRKLESEWVA